jgi:hypothetical protein
VWENDNAGSADELVARRYRSVNSQANFSLDATVRFAKGSARGLELANVLVGTFDIPGTAKKVVWTHRESGSPVYVATGFGNGSMWANDYRWELPRPQRGLAWDGSSWWSIGSDGVLTKYSQWTWTDGSDYVHAGFTWVDSDPAGASTGAASPHPGQPAGTHETTLGAVATVKLDRRAKLRATMPVTPDKGGVDDPDKWRLYMVKTTTPAPPLVGLTVDASKFKRQAEGGSPTAALIRTITDLDLLGSAPPTSNNFPGASPARFKSAQLLPSTTDPVIDLKGDGSWKLGPMRGYSDGTAADDRVRVGTVDTGVHVVGTVKTTAVVFNPPFPAGVTPAVFLQVNSGAQPHQYDYEANNVTNTGFDLNSYRNAGTAALTIVYRAITTTG